MQPSAFMDVDSIDKVRRTVTFVLGPEIGAAAVKALAGTSIFAAGSDLVIGKVAAVEAKPALKRSFVTVKIDDATAWLKAKAGVFKGAQAKVYGDKLGSLNLTDAPHERTEVLQKAAPPVDPAAFLRAAIDRANPERPLAKAAPPRTPGERLRVAIDRANAQLAEPIAKLADGPAMWSPEWWSKMGCAVRPDGSVGFLAEVARENQQAFLGAWRAGTLQ